MIEWLSCSQAGMGWGSPLFKAHCCLKDVTTWTWENFVKTVVCKHSLFANDLHSVFIKVWHSIQTFFWTSIVNMWYRFLSKMVSVIYTHGGRPSPQTLTNSSPYRVFPQVPVSNCQCWPGEQLGGSLLSAISTAAILRHAPSLSCGF